MNDFAHTATALIRQEGKADIFVHLFPSPLCNIAASPLPSCRGMGIAHIPFGIGFANGAQPAETTAR